MIRHFVVALYKIPSASMEDTLFAGDFLVGTKFNWGVNIDFLGVRIPGFSCLERGDVAIFLHPSEKGMHYIKRCVGVSGDVISYKNKTLFVNGVEEVRSNNIKSIDSNNLRYRDNFFSIIVPSPGDTLRFGNNTIMEFEFNKNLYIQHYGNDNIEVRQHLVIDGIKFYSYSFRNFNYPDLNLRSNKFDTLNWIVLQSYVDIIGKDNPNSNVQLKQSLFHNEREVKKFVVRERCYFFMGDNRDASHDSRFFGFISHKNISAKPVIIYFSVDRDAMSLFRKVRWDRMGKLVH